MHARRVNSVAGETQDLSLWKTPVSRMDNAVCAATKCVKHTLKLRSIEFQNAQPRTIINTDPSTRGGPAPVVVGAATIQDNPSHQNPQKAATNIQNPRHPP